MKLTIISGGTGNDSLVRGLKNLYNGIDIKVVLSAYDNGKSTGVCRTVTDTLGVSDIRKNHIRMYKALTPVQDQDKRLVEFYESRYNLCTSMGTFDNFTLCRLLTEWGLEEKFGKYATNFIKKVNDKSIPISLFKDFNVANIIMAEMYSELGYEETNRISCELLGIEDFVILNSFDNVYLNAITEKYNIIADEGEIVELKDANNKIINTFYSPSITPTLNQKAINAIMNCDLLLISTGTFWSSIYPTLQYGDLYKYVNQSTAKKIWAINNTEDKDAYGVSSNDFINLMSKLGLDLSQFTILENLDAIESLQQDNPNYNIVKAHMGNDEKGRHTGYKVAKELLNLYYGISKDAYDCIIFDFDDTLYSRVKTSEDCSNSNLAYLSKLNQLVDVKIVSGNTYTSIYNKIIPFFGLITTELPEIWADANTQLYVNDYVVGTIDSHIICQDDLDTIHDLICKYPALEEKVSYVYLEDEEYICNIKFKPLTQFERELLCDLINDQIGLYNSVAKITGKTTVDILSKDNSKINVLNKLDCDKILYVGDEVDQGNDAEIAKACKAFIQVDGVEETNTVLKLLVEVFSDKYYNSSR